MEFLHNPMTPVQAVQSGRLLTDNWDELLQFSETLDYDEEKVEKINAEGKAKMEADGKVTWEEIVSTAASYVPQFVNPEKAKDLDINMHFKIGGQEEVMGSYTLTVKEGKATFNEGLNGEATSTTAMDSETFISVLVYGRKEDAGELELSDSDLEGIAGGKGSTSATCGGDACGAAAGNSLCGAAATGAGVCAAQGCVAAATGAGACGGDICGAAVCGLVLTGVDACGADACPIDVIPGFPFI